LWRQGSDKAGAVAASNITVVQPPIDAVDWDALAARMDVPDDRREHFIWWLKANVEARTYRYSFLELPAKAAPPPRRTSRNANTARTGRAFLRALN
jgi:hypothetical protein